MSAEHTSAKPTPGPWFVRTRKQGEKVVDCFVAAKDVQGFPYDAEIMGDDEYRDGIERKLADANLIAAAPDLLTSLQELLPMWLSGIDEPWVRRARAAIAKATGSTVVQHLPADDTEGGEA